jgi:hypothetical protein
MAAPGNAINSTISYARKARCVRMAGNVHHSMMPVCYTACSTACDTTQQPSECCS